MKKYLGALVLAAMAVGFKLVGLPAPFSWASAALAILVALTEATP